jgi:hypothetical protein
MYIRSITIAAVTLGILLSCTVAATHTVAAQEADQAKLRLSPETGVHTVGDTFRVKVLVESRVTPVNAVEGTIRFDTDRLRIENISTQGTVFPVWTQSPERNDGTLTFSTGAQEPYEGDAGSVFTITFAAERAGEATISFADGALLAADGSGSNILTQMVGANHTIRAQSVDPETEYVVPDNAPGAPEVRSKTHPRESQWYATSTAELSWSLPSDVTNVRYAFNESPKAVPSTMAQTRQRTYTARNVSDGEHYFHVQLKDANGWGAIAHYRVAVDTTAPSYFNIVQEERTDTTDPRMRMFLDGLDAQSGIARYEITIDDELHETRSAATSSVYRLPVLQPGQHTVHVRAQDRAGNAVTDTWTFAIDSLEPPILTQYPSVLRDSEPLIVKGLTFPNTEVTMYLKRGSEPPQTFTVASDDDGAFTFIPDTQPTDGVYQLWAEVTDARGAQSAPSRKVTIAVQPPVLFEIGNVAVSALSVFVPLIALLIVLGMLVGFIWHRVKRFRRRVRREAGEASEALHDAFDQLRKRVRRTIKTFEDTERNRELTKEERATLSQLRTTLDEAERSVAEEIEDIEDVRW